MKIVGFSIKKLFDKLWGLLFLISLCALLISQFALTIPTFRDSLAPISETKGVSGQVEGGLALGEITLSLQGVEPSADIKVLQNGVPIAFFTTDTLTVSVRHNSLIEIDGTKVANNFVINIEDYSGNISFAEGKTSTDVSNNIAILARVFVQ